MDVAELMDASKNQDLEEYVVPSSAQAPKLRGRRSTRGGAQRDQRVDTGRAQGGHE